MIMPAERESTNPKRFDIVIVDHGVELMIYVIRNLPQRKAIRWLREWLDFDMDGRPIMLLPAGSKAPLGYEVADLDDFEVLA